MSRDMHQLGAFATATCRCKSNIITNVHLGTEAIHKLEVSDSVSNQFVPKHHRWTQSWWAAMSLMLMAHVPGGAPFSQRSELGGLLSTLRHAKYLREVS